MALRAMLEYVHFNANKPEFQNIKYYKANEEEKSQTKGPAGIAGAGPGAGAA